MYPEPEKCCTLFPDRFEVALVVFGQDVTGNAFGESAGFSRQEDLVYRNKAISEILRIDT